MRLIDRMSRRALPDPETVAAMTTTWPESKRETIPQTYDAYAAHGYYSNATVFAVTLARLQLIAQADLKWQNLTTGRLFGTTDLALLERPWPNGTTGDLLAKMEQHNTLSGNAFVRRVDDRLMMLRPDRVEIVRAEVRLPDGSELDDVMGYVFHEDGIGLTSDPVFIPVDEVAHWCPIPDPTATFRGMSWMTPVLREINADAAMVQHKQTFFDQAATPNLMIKYQQKLTQDAFEAIKARWQARYGGPSGAGGTVILDNGADLTVVGSTFESMDFTNVQAAGEARIAQAAGVPPIVAGLQSGLDAATYSNYAMAMRAFANSTMTYLWQSAVAALSKLVDPPTGSRLWYATDRIPALQDAETDRAVAAKTYAEAASTLITAGYQPDSIQSALMAGDMGLLTHTGMVSVQLQNPGSTPPAAGGTP